MFHSKKISAGLGVITAGLLATGVAYAAWTGSGTGSGSAKASSLAVATESSSITSKTLFPGGAAGDVIVKVKNPNSGSIVITEIASRVGVDSAAITGCTTPGVTFTAPSASGFQTTFDEAARTIAAGATAEFTLADSASMDLTSSNDCQGQTLTVPVTVHASTPAAP